MGSVRIVSTRMIMDERGKHKIYIPKKSLRIFEPTLALICFVSSPGPSSLLTRGFETLINIVLGVYALLSKALNLLLIVADLSSPELTITSKWSIIIS